MINHTLEKAYYYNDLTDYEKDVLKTFDNLITCAGCKYDFYYSDHTEGLGGLCIVKEGDAWKSYIDERGSFHCVEEYNDIYDLVCDIFDTLESDTSCYCINNFPSKEEFKSRNKQR